MGFFSISEQRDAHITVGGMEMSVCEAITAGYKLLPNDCYFFCHASLASLPILRDAKGDFSSRSFQ